MTEFSFFDLSPYICLFLSVGLTLAGRGDLLKLGLMTLALALGFFNGIFDFVGLAILLVTPLSLFIWVNHYFADVLRKFGLVVFLICAGILGTHSLSGLDNLKVFDQVVINMNSVPFNMYFNFDKVFLALVIISLLPELERSLGFKSSLFTVFKYYLVSALVLLPLALLSGYVQFQVNTNPYVLLWALNNFFFVCFTEEIIFRRFIQNGLVDYFRNAQYGDLVAIFIGAVIFGVAHFSGGFLYMGLATLAGVFYGLCFYHTSNIRSSMALHFGVNLTHILFFTYPFAA